MCRNPSSAASETYIINMNTLNYGQPEEFLALLNNFNIDIDGIGTTTPSGRINYLRTMLCRQVPRKFDELQSQNGGSTNNHLNIITEGLLEYILPINSLYKQKRVTRHAMRKSQIMTFKRFAARFTEMNNFLQLFPGLDVTKKMTHEELNRILLHAVPNEWGKQSYIKGWDSEMKTYKETCAMLSEWKFPNKSTKG